MSLTVLTTHDEPVEGNALLQLVEEQSAQGAVVVLVPSFSEALRVQRHLADKGMALGVEVGTPRSWAADAWDVWGDGCRVIDAPARTLLMTRALQSFRARRQCRIRANKGTVRLLGDLADRYLPWIDDVCEFDDEPLTRAEHEGLLVLREYARLLRGRGLAETSHCLCALPQALADAGARMPIVVFAGFDDLSRTERTFAVGLARHARVTVLVRTGTVIYDEQALRMRDQLVTEALDQGVEVRHAEKTSCDANPRAEELVHVLGSLFRSAGTPVRATGAVGLLDASGPLAEAELVAREVAALAQEGRTNAVVVVPDARRAWRELAPKLVARGVSVRAQISVPVLSTEAGRAFMGYVRTVALLEDLARTWPSPRRGADGIYARVGNMSWWPPHELVDFLLHDIAHVDLAKAQALDIAWRADRLLAPADVLAQLQSAKTTSDPVERATRELLRGRVGSAASKLLAPYVQGGLTATTGAGETATSLAREESVAVLGAVLSVANTLKELGVTADPTIDGAVSLSELASHVELALGTMRVTLRPAVQAERERGRSLLLTRGQASTLAPASVDVAVLCGLTSTEMAVPAADDEISGMVESLGLDEPRDALLSQRVLFSKLCALPRERLLLERTLFAADAYETYPAVMLTELLECCDGELSCSSLAEDEARANVGARGAAPSCEAYEEVAPAGIIDPALCRLVTVPQEGRAELPGGLPVLSASQLESYLECPLKWFSLRRLRLQDNDAGFGPLEMGTFAHRVLELTFAQLFEEGKARLDWRDQEGLAHAHDVLDACFTLHREHQHMRGGSRPVYQALIAHSAQEESQMDRLRRDLESTLDYTAQRLQGYEPYAFEWEFGRGKATSEQGGLPALAEATYAGVRVTGTVDRIDINGQGQAVIIDYKHKGPTGFFAEYAALGRTNAAGEGNFVLPRRIQALMYAQVVRRAFPDLRLVGALYLGTRGTHELSGAVEESQADAVFGGMLGPRRAGQVVVMRNETFGCEDARGMEALLDATEEAVARQVERLREGHIEAGPVDAASCSFCPVGNCERRL